MHDEFAFRKAVLVQTLTLADAPTRTAPLLRIHFPRRTIAGMPIDVISLHDAADTVCDWADKRRARLVVTPNTDHLLRWARSPEFAALYKRADLYTLDSSILRILAKVEGGEIPDRVTGADLLLAAAEQAARRGIPLILIGGGPSVAERAAENLQHAFPGLRIPFISVPDSADLMSPVWLDETARRLREHPRKVVALCLGSPKQERLFADLQARSVGISGVYLCVGAAIDFAAGTVTRAPKLLQDLSLEWLYRLAQEPRRLWRRYLVEDVAVARYFVNAILRRAFASSRRRPPARVDERESVLDVRMPLTVSR
jgi:N-acetylglucosaminyldiphosphoundecaprenol N-acetyl-beta-D-mannosaminyltransferase